MCVCLCVFTAQFAIYHHVPPPSISTHDYTSSLVLEKLRKFSLQVKLSKCLFDQTEIEFLGFIVNRNGISIDSSRVATIIDWPEPKNYRDVQVFLAFANFYRRFINEFSRIVAALTTLLKGERKESSILNSHLPKKQENYFVVSSMFLPPLLCYCILTLSGKYN